jgi:predicted nucleotidyltransferase component of viral defense system
MKSRLTPLQQQFLAQFFASSVGQRFFLTGGTALAEYYLHHRHSEDLDLFTLSDEALESGRQSMNGFAASVNATLHHGTSSPWFQEYFLQRGDELPLKIDMVRDVNVQFGEYQKFGGVIVDSMLNIAVNKVTAIFGRTEMKDFVDLYFMLQQEGYDFEALVEMAKQKDTGLTEFYLAGMLRQIEQIQHLPALMYREVSLETLSRFYLELSDNLLRKINPT